jgi:hypothetical protein
LPRLRSEIKEQVRSKGSYQGIALAMPKVRDQIPLQGLRRYVSHRRRGKQRLYRRE